MEIQKRSMNWMPRASMYDEMQSHAARRRDSNDRFLSTQASMASSFSTITTNHSAGMAEITAKVMLARVRKTA